MSKSVVSLILISTILILQTETYRILGIFPHQWKSHHVLLDSITMELARRGHQMDVVTRYPFKIPVRNYKVVAKLTIKDETLIKPWDIKFASEFDNYTRMSFGKISTELCEELGHPDIQRILKHPPNDPPYDLIIIEAFASRCFIGIGYVLKIPVIFISSFTNFPWISYFVGQPINTAYIPYILNSYTHPMTFYERVLNTFNTHYDYYLFRFLTDGVQNTQMRKYLDPNIPSVHELRKYVAIALINSYHSLQDVRPIAPNFVEIAGAHIFNHHQNLSHELERWMNESTAGVIYFALGSMIKIETFPEDVMIAFYTVFRKLVPIRVLMKVNNKKDLLPGLPDNVRISSWIPQIGVLAHKNTKVFITHGGVLGCLEALTFRVPMIGMPFFADQFSNVQCFVKKNMSHKLDLNNLNEDSIYEALHEVLHNPKYKNAAKLESARFLDRPLTAMDTAIYWIEYVGRNGLNALQSPAIDMPWWRAALLDVYLFVFICIIFVILIILLIVKIALNILLYEKFKNE